MTDLIEWQDRCSAYRQACRGKAASVSACGGSVEEWPERLARHWASGRFGRSTSVAVGGWECERELRLSAHRMP